jgi:hypothetical protein
LVDDLPAFSSDRTKTTATIAIARYQYHSIKISKYRKWVHGGSSRLDPETCPQLGSGHAKKDRVSSALAEKIIASGDLRRRLLTATVLPPYALETASRGHASAMPEMSGVRRRDGSRCQAGIRFHMRNPRDPKNRSGRDGCHDERNRQEGGGGETVRENVTEFQHANLLAISSWRLLIGRIGLA